MSVAKPFWETKTLQEMSRTEWESLCDGCGKCCLNKLINDEGDIFFTDVACWLFDRHECRCKDYGNRKAKVPDCVVLTADEVTTLKWLPASCAYKVLSVGGKLADWHPLISGDPESVHRGKNSVRGQTVSENDVLDLEDRIIDWIE